MKVLVDAHGGDNAPLEIVRGAVDAVNSHSDLIVELVGKTEIITPMIKEIYQGDRITVTDAREEISGSEVPTKAIREKKDSSMVKGLTLLHNDSSYAGMVSAGSTGALLTGALLICKRIKGISRPALVPVAPTVKGTKFVLVDCGANADCKPVNLQHFALMGTCFMRAMFGIAEPTLGLLNNGTEEGKGNELTKETYDLLKETSGINFKGNMEAREMLFGDYDVIVCDGFTGNIALKANEGMAKAIMKLLKDGINETGIKGKIGALCLKNVLKDIKKTMDVNEQAGGTFLGVERIVVKAHGSSTRISIKNCIEQVMTLAKNEIVDKIKSGLTQIGGGEECTDITKEK